MGKFVVLIPAYQPNIKLLELVEDMCKRNIDIFVVDDGSGKEYEDIFLQVEVEGANVLRHKVNQGKGASIKTGISVVMEKDDVSGIVTADADGQHAIKDIIRIIEEMANHPETLVIGTRSFSTETPFRSRFGNSITRIIFRIITGLNISDTQTGLRGLPKNLFAQLIKLQGKRYEYEMNMLLKIEQWRIPYMEVPIETIYLEDNQSSHFHPLRDSLLIYKRIIVFFASSLISFFVDYGAYAFFSFALYLAPWASYIFARIISSLINYTINRHVVFGTNRKRSLIKYYGLALCIMVTGSRGVDFLTMLGTNEILAKLIIDMPLFLVSYTVQRKHVF